MVVMVVVVMVEGGGGGEGVAVPQDVLSPLDLAAGAGSAQRPPRECCREDASAYPAPWGRLTE